MMNVLIILFSLFFTFFLVHGQNMGNANIKSLVIKRGSVGECLEPKTSSELRTCYVEKGSAFTLLCTFEWLSSEKIIFWSFDGSEIARGGATLIDNENIRVNLESQSYELDITTAGTESAGDYTCKLNVTPLKVVKMRIVVIVPPEIYESPASSMTVTEGESASLTCKAHGEPAPTITWSRTTEGENLPNDLATFEGETLNALFDSQDFGTIRCTAANGISTTTAYRDIFIRVNFPPYCSALEKYQAEVGDRLTIVATVAGYPPIDDYVWQTPTNARPGTGTMTEKYATAGITGLAATTSSRSSYSLTVKTMTMDDFGEYIFTVRAADKLAESINCKVVKILVAEGKCTVGCGSYAIGDDVFIPPWNPSSGRGNIPLNLAFYSISLLIIHILFF